MRKLGIILISFLFMVLIISSSSMGQAGILLCRAEAKISDGYPNPNPAKVSDSVTFTGTAVGRNADFGIGIGTCCNIVSYKWESDKDGVLCEGSDCRTHHDNSLSAGTHLITFNAKEQDPMEGRPACTGDWLTSDSKTLIIDRIPTAYIDSVDPNPVYYKNEVSFSGRGTDPDSGDYITAYEWKDGDTVISSDSSFSKSDFSIGAHTIYFRVKDSRGFWSVPVSETLTVDPPEVTAEIVSIDPQISGEGQAVSFEGSGSSTSGSITGYEWKSSLVPEILSTEKEFSAELPTGNNTISLKVMDENEFWSEEVYSWVYVGEKPIIDFITVTPKVEYGEKVSFGLTAHDPDGYVDGYEWSSDIDGFLSDKRIFSSYDLSTGYHTIYARVKDDLGVWSDAKTVKIRVTSRYSTGRPVQVIPRYSSLGTIVRAYNVTPGYPNIYCKISYGGIDASCSQLDGVVDSCPVNGLDSSVLDFDLVSKEKHLFTIASRMGAPIPIKPIVLVGNIDIIFNSPEGYGDPYDFGHLEDYSFYPSGLVMDITTNRDLDMVKVGSDWYSGLLYQIYKVENCALYESSSLTAFGYFGASKDHFFTSVPMPTDCSIGETCEYVGEIIALNGSYVGGSLFTFTYTKSAGVLEMDPELLDLGTLEPGENVTGEVIVTNVGEGDIDLLTADVDPSTHLKVSLDKDSLRKDASAILTVKVEIPGNATEGDFTEYVNLTTTTDSESSSSLYTVIFGIRRPTGDIVPDPDSVEFGTLNQGAHQEEDVILENLGDLIVTDLNATIAFSDIGLSLDKTEINPGDYAILTVEIDVPFTMTPGNYSEDILVTGSGGEEDVNLTIPVNFEYEWITGELIVTPTSVYFGTVPRGGTAMETVSVVNNGDADITGLTVTTPVGITSTLEETSIEPGETTTLILELHVPSQISGGDYTDTVTVESYGGQRTSITITYSVEEAPGAIVDPSLWDIGSIAPGSTTSNIFTVGLESGIPEGVTVTVSADDFLDDYLSITPGFLDLETDDTVSVTLTAPQEEDVYTNYIYFEFEQDGSSMGTITATVTFEVKEDLESLISDASARHDQLTRELAELEAIAGVGTRTYKKIQDNITMAHDYLDAASQYLQESENALNVGDANSVKIHVNDANSEMSDADEIISHIRAYLGEGQKESNKFLKPVIIIVALVGILGFLIAALREGWISAQKYPALANFFKKIGLGSFIEKPASMEPRPRFAAPRAARVAPPARPPARMTPEQAAMRARWQAYYREHPEYARYVQQRYRSYYNRRYRQ